MADTKTMPPGRALVLNAMLSVFISCVVFAVIALVVLVPQMARQELEIRELRASVVALQNALDEANKEPAAAPAAPAPAAVNPATPAAPAATPANPTATAPLPPAKTGK